MGPFSLTGDAVFKFGFFKIQAAEIGEIELAAAEEWLPKGGGIRPIHSEKFAINKFSLAKSRPPHIGIAQVACGKSAVNEFAR